MCELTFMYVNIGIYMTEDNTDHSITRTINITHLYHHIRKYVIV